MGPATMTFLAWVVFGLVGAALAAPKEHWTGLVYFGGYWGVALIGGAIHAIIVRRRSTPNKAQNK
jgi:hypothetical protein